MSDRRVDDLAGRNVQVWPVRMLVALITQLPISAAKHGTGFFEALVTLAKGQTLDAC